MPTGFQQGRTELILICSDLKVSSLLAGCLGFGQVTVLDASKADLAAFRHGWEAGRCVLQNLSPNSQLQSPCQSNVSMGLTPFGGSHP